MFGDTELTDTKGLDTCQHQSPSIVDHRTLSKSAKLPLAFLRGVGLPDRLIEYLPSLLGEAIQFYASACHKLRGTLGLSSRCDECTTPPNACRRARAGATMMLPESVLNRLVSVKGQWKRFSDMTDEDLAWTRAALERGEHVPGAAELRAALETAWRQSPPPD